VLIMRTSDADSVQVSMPEFHLSSAALVPTTPAVVRLSSRGTGHDHLLQPIMQRKWRMGEVCLQSNATTADVQGARVAGFGDYDVTDTKFSIRLGPPSCSPPV
jgi:hypothetical protein